jgi:hypothetical protein
MSVNVRAAHWHLTDPRHFVVIVQFNDPAEGMEARRKVEEARKCYPIAADAKVVYGCSRHVPTELCYEREAVFFHARSAKAEGEPS